MTRKLGEIALVVMGQSPAGEDCNRSGEGLPLLNGPTEFGPMSPSPVQFTTDARKRAAPGDLLFCVRGSTTGRMNWADREYAIGRGVAAIRHNTDARLQPFVRALIERRLPELLSAATGSTFPNVSAAQLAGIPLPDLREEDQLKLATLLRMFDDKIELNRRMNETLEATARAIFRDWFVDFGPTRAKMAGAAPYLAADLWALFPNRLDEEGKPDGWATTRLGESFRITMGQSPPGETYNEDGEGLPFFQGRRDFGWRFPSRRVFCRAPTRVAQAEDTLVSVRAPVGDLNVAWEQCCIGRGVAAVRHAGGGRGYTYYALQALQPQLSAFEHTGTVFGAINKKQFDALTFIEPSEDVVKAFEGFVTPFDDRIRANAAEIETLTETRDLLLPKLMSGEIRLKDVERVLEDAA